MSCRHQVLSGLRVLDMTRVLAGPYATMLLGDLGAEILKIEDPSVGDVTRSWGPPFVNGQSAYYLSINRNKKSLAINLKHEEGIKIVKKLAECSDVLIENYVPGKLDAMGLGYDSIKQTNQKIIYCSITGYGSDGPYSNRGGYDVIASSIGGLNHITGPEDGDPCRVGVAMTDLSTGLLAKSSILAALYSRDRTGKGMKIDCNLLSTQISVLTHIASNFLNCGVAAQRWGTAHPSIVPYESFLTRDGRYITVGAGTNKDFKALCMKLELEDLPSAEKYMDNSNRVKNRKELLPLIAEKFLQKTCDEWLADFKDCTFPFGPINDIEQAFNDPQVLHNNMVLNLNNSQGDSSIKVAGHPVVFDKKNDYSGNEDVHPPLLGEHTYSTLKNILSLSDDRMNDLSKMGVIVNS